MLCYQAEPLEPLKPYGASRLDPVVVKHVADGYLKGQGNRVVNPPEAQAVADTIQKCIDKKIYEGKTFGVISLLGHFQAREIEKRLLEQLGPEEMVRRQLVCGDAYAFQGDERDVIFLSLVSAPAKNRKIGTLTRDTHQRRFNVATSRAREQMWLFHTATLNDLSPKCLRYKLLEYCKNPHVAPAELAGKPLDEYRHLASNADRDRIPAPEPFESWFELDVFIRIASRGFRVLPQYEMAGYRIDLVVEGMQGKLAVECDGDHWHGPDQYEEDTKRQRTLERCGWRFWRIRGSAFKLDPDASMESLWETLKRLGIHPEG